MKTGILIAQQQDPAPAPKAPPDMGPFGHPLFLPAVIGLFILTMVVLPARKAKKEQQNLLAALKPGAKVILSSGIVGSVVKVHDTEGEVTIRSDDVKLRVLRSSIATIRGTEETAETK